MIKFERRSTCKPTAPPSSTPDRPSRHNGSPKTSWASPLHTSSAHTTRKHKPQTYCPEVKGRHRHCLYSSNPMAVSTKTNCIIFIKKNKASTSLTTPKKIQPKWFFSKGMANKRAKLWKSFWIISSAIRMNPSSAAETCWLARRNWSKSIGKIRGKRNATSVTICKE